MMDGSGGTSDLAAETASQVSSSQQSTPGADTVSTPQQQPADLAVSAEPTSDTVNTIVSSNTL